MAPTALSEELERAAGVPQQVWRRERVLAVCADREAAAAIIRPLADEGYNCTVALGLRPARERLQRAAYDLLLCDLRLPDGSGAELAREVARRPPRRRTRVVVISGPDEVATAGALVHNGVAGYVMRPIRDGEIVTLVHSVLGDPVGRRWSDAPVEAQLAHRFANAADAWDPGAAAHIAAVGDLSARLAAALALPANVVEQLRFAARLHDVGNVGLGGLLCQPRQLVGRECAHVRQHTEAGYRILAGSGHEWLELAADVAWMHHERRDGTGYPRGLSGDAIPIEARIVAVADVFDALTRQRPHRQALTPADAERRLTDQSARFDADVLSALQALLAEGMTPATDPRVAAGAGLSRREREVLRLTADGLSAVRIAEQLVLSPGTVKTHLRNIYPKLEARDRASAVAQALRKGIIS